MDPGCAPEGIRRHHLVDECPNRRGPRAAGMFLPRPLRPATSQPLAMPAHDRVWLDDEQGAAPLPPGLGEHDPKESVTRAKMRAFCAARQRGHLLTQREVLERDGPAPSAEQSDRSEKYDQRRQHP